MTHIIMLYAYIHAYISIDLWTCDRKIEDIDVWTMENEFLKVTITPQYAGIIN